MDNSVPPSYEQIYQQLTVPNSSNQSYDQRLRDVIQKFEISSEFASKLQILTDFKVVFILDDSTSMQTIVNYSILYKYLSEVSRWDELKYFCQVAIEIVNTVKQDEGIDIYFLNRQMARNIRTMEELMPHMRDLPEGYSPLTQILQRVLNEQPNNQPLLIIIVTDGKPSLDDGTADIDGFRRCLETRPDCVYTSIVATTYRHTNLGNIVSFNYLKNWDITIPRLHVVGDFKTETNKVMRMSGIRLSFGDYILKALLGSLDRDIDMLDKTCVCNII